MALGDVARGVPGYEPAAVPLYEDAATVEREYREARRTGAPYFAVEAREDGYAVTYDLLPAGAQLSEPVADAVADRITGEVEAIVSDEDLPTAEVSRSVGPSLAHVAVFDREESARRVAAAVSDLVLDEGNWEEARQPEGAQGSRRN